MSGAGQRMQEDVLKLLKQKQIPMSAYDVLDHLKHETKRLAPPTIYRALAGLAAKGKVHKLESRNAYVACQHGEHSNSSILSICGVCDTVEEFVCDDVMGQIENITQASGFSAQTYIIEIHGKCASCCC